MTHSNFRHAAILAAAVFALAGGLPACGSSDDDNSDSGGQSAAKAPSSNTTNAASKGDTPAPAPTGSVKEQVAALVKASEDAYRAGDGNAYCQTLTEAGQKEIAVYARSVGQDPSCPGFIEAASRKVRELGITQKPSRIVSVRANGDKATAMISINRKPPRPTKFVNVDGQWKLVTAGIGSF